MTNKIITNEYIMYGLNRNRRFLRLPKANRIITLSTAEELEAFSLEILKSKDCECALFYVHLDGTYSSVFKTVVEEEYCEDDMVETTYSICKIPPKKDMHMFSWLDGEFRFCCYSLLKEIDYGVYEVCV